ncbi:MAG TPA: methyltransferase domain-containing protein [Terrimesophilobacter sp.]|nr:methyltransferase domain-containing protein [Terrimesophilobacter sp.]
MGIAHGFLTERDATLHELMDDPGADPQSLRRTYDGFRVLNPLVAGWRGVYRRIIRPLLSRYEERTLLDVGSGGGDVTRSLARWAARDGVRLRVLGIDPDERAHAYSLARPRVDGVEFRRAFLHDIDETFDFVVSNHVLHHLDDAAAFLREAAARTRILTVHSDLVRSRVAYAAFSVLSAPFFAGSFIRADGLTSIRRSYTVDELRAIVPEGWRVVPTAPSRLLALSVPAAPGPDRA